MCEADVLNVSCLSEQSSLMSVFSFVGLEGNATLIIYNFFFQRVFECAQGFTNFLLFCLFTEKFQENFLRVMHSHCPYACFANIWTYNAGEQSYHSDDSPVSGEYSEMNETSSLFRTSDLIRNYQTTSY